MKGRIININIIVNIEIIIVILNQTGIFIRRVKIQTKQHDTNKAITVINKENRAKKNNLLRTP